MRVSVIIPTYNHRDYVLQTLDSVFAQTFEDYEIIVINDGSPDDSAEVLQPLTDAGKIRYFEQANAGQSAARNRGLAVATGEFIAFLDDDDLWPPDKLRWQVEFLDEHPDVAVIGGSVQPIDGQGEKVMYELFYQKPLTLESLFRGSPFVSPGQTVIRTEALRKIGGLNEKLWGVDDYDMWFQLLKSETIEVRPQLSLCYRYHSANASNNRMKMFHNVLKVVHTELPHARATLRTRLVRETYRSLYPGVGTPAISRLRIHKLSSLSGALQEVKALSHFMLPALRDHKLTGMMLRDCVPNTLKKKKSSK